MEQAPGSEVIEQTIAAKVAAAVAEGADAAVATTESKAAPDAALRPEAEAEAEAWAAARAAVAKAAEESAADGLFPDVEVAALEEGAVATEVDGDVCDWTKLDDTCK